MPTTDDRIWAPHGRGLIARARDGRRDLRVTVTPMPGEGPPPDTAEHTRLLREIADVHNGLNETQRQVMEEIRAADWPLTSGELARRTDFSKTYMDQVLDQLTEQGLIERPQKGTSGQRRPVRLARAEEGAIR
jgi:predicted transcriptional regulator